MAKPLTLAQLKDQLELLQTLQKNFKYILAAAKSSQQARSIGDARIMLSPQRIENTLELLDAIQLTNIQLSSGGIFDTFVSSIRNSIRQSKLKVLTADDLEDQANRLIALIHQLDKYIEAQKNLLYAASLFDIESLKFTLQQKLKSGQL